jgi:DNA polymerase bacteriophage-type
MLYPALAQHGVRQIAFVDFETHFTDTYSLSKMSVRDYVEDPRFEILGMGFALDDEEALFVSEPRDLSMVLRGIDWSVTAFAAQNCRFDGHIAAQRLKIRPALFLDTLSMARAEIKPFTGSVSLASIATYLANVLRERGVHVQKDQTGALAFKNLRRHELPRRVLEGMKTYCLSDVELLRGAFHWLMETEAFDAEEMLLIDRTLRGYNFPMLRLDASLLQATLTKIVADKADLLTRVGLTKEDLMSDAKLAAVLESFGVPPLTKISPRTGKTNYAFAKTDLTFVRMQQHANPDVAALVSARLGVKSTIEETRTKRFLDIALTHGTTPVPLAYCSAHTTRFGGDEKMNWQNIGRKSPIRKAVMAPKGTKLVVADASQIEARILAKIAGQHNITQQFSDGEDVYARAGDYVYGFTAHKATHPNERQVCKVAVLSLGYIAGAATFQHMCTMQGIKMTLGEATVIVDKWRANNPAIVKLWGALHQAVLRAFTDKSGRQHDFRGVVTLGYDIGRNAGYMELPNGLRIWYPDPRIGRDERRDRDVLGYTAFVGKTAVFKPLASNMLINNLVQGLARCITMQHGMVLARKLWLALTVHDELVFIVPEAKANAAADLCLTVMRKPPLYMPDLPLNAEVAIADRYGDAK